MSLGIAKNLLPGGATIDNTSIQTRQRTVDPDEGKNSYALVIPKEVVSRGNL